MPTDDYTKDLEEEIARYALPNPFRHKRTWRLLFISSDGRVTQSGNYRRVVTTTLVILALLSLTVVATTGLWLQARTHLSESQVLQCDLKATLLQQAASQERLMARLALTGDKMPAEGAGTSEPEPRKASLSSLASFVRMDTLETHRSEDGTSLKITFTLHNDTPDKSLSKGHMFLVFPPRDGNKQVPRTLPPALLKNGLPSDPTLGESFHLRNFNALTFKLHTEVGELPYSEMILYVFDDSGTLRYEKKSPL